MGIVEGLVWIVTIIAVAAITINKHNRILGDD